MKRTLTFFLRLISAAIVLASSFSWLALSMSWRKRKAARSFRQSLLSLDVPENVAEALAEDYKATLKFRDLLQLGETLRSSSTPREKP
ncbi:MAG: hypothetical protein QW057_08415 [Candidatus Bathyarchaeia archaeon]